jgi:hypothetical protein
VRAGGDEEVAGVQVDVERSDDRRDVGLVGRLVGREAHVPVDPEDLHGAEDRRQLRGQLLHRSAHLGLVLLPVRLEVALGVVHLETPEKSDEVTFPSFERHGEGHRTPGAR